MCENPDISKFVERADLAIREMMSGIIRVLGDELIREVKKFVENFDEEKYEPINVGVDASCFAYATSNDEVSATVTLDLQKGADGKWFIVDARDVAITSLYIEIGNFLIRNHSSNIREKDFREYEDQLSEIVETALLAK